MITQEVSDFDPRLQGLFTCLLAGPTGSGKTQLVFKLIENADKIINLPMKAIVYCYGQWLEINKESLLSQGLLPRENLFHCISGRESVPSHTLLIIDYLLDMEHAPIV